MYALWTPSGPQKPCGDLMAAIQADHWRWWLSLETIWSWKHNNKAYSNFVGICRYLENSWAYSRLDFTEKSPLRTEVALEFVQSSISAIWSQPSDSDYKHTPNGCFSFMRLRFRAALYLISKSKTTLSAAFLILKWKSTWLIFLWEKKFMKHWKGNILPAFSVWNVC